MASAVSTASWKSSRLCGGSFADLSSYTSSVLLASLKQFLVLTPSALKLYSLTTSKCVRIIPLSSAADVADIYLQNESSLWVAFKDGTLLSIDCNSWFPGSKIDLGMPIHSILSISEDTVVFFSLQNSIAKLCLAKPDLRRSASAIIDDDLPVVTFSQKSVLYSSDEPISLIELSPAKSYFAIAFAKYVVTGKLSTDNSAVELLKIDRPHPPTSLAVSESGCLAIGSSSGVIDLYTSLFSSANAVPKSLKWHMKAVTALQFAMGDQYLLSGGQEKVLVFWQLETNSTQFLPRLPGPITKIAVDSLSTFYTISCKSQDVMLISAVDLLPKITVSSVKSTISLDPTPVAKSSRRKSHRSLESSSDLPVLMVAHPVNEYLYLPTYYGSQLQTYNFALDRQEAIQQFASTLQMGKIYEEELITDAQLIHIAFSHNAQWMMTVDELPTPNIDNIISQSHTNINLRFWRSDPSTPNNWILTSRTESPHGYNRKVLGVASAPSSYSNGLAFATLSDSGDIHLWKPKTHFAENDELNPSSKRPVEWTLRRTLPACPMHTSAVALTWSSDGSMIVLGVETTLQLIDTESFTVVKTLPNVLSSRIRALRIVGHDLVCLAKSSLVVLNLLTLKVKWTLKMSNPQNSERLFAASTDNKRFAVGFNYANRSDYSVKGRVLVFATDSIVPEYMASFEVPVVSVTFSARTGGFLALDNSSVVHAIYKSSSSLNLQAVDETEEQVATSNGVLSSIVPQKIREITQPEFIEDEAPQQILLTETKFDDVFSGPDFAMANLEGIFEKVLSTIS
ncbi:hypothetical protein CANCADRAFT_43039 [Tortispora caseinolytica NRRL Y-17796]|uniref:WD repeat-containing protein 75 second beta-propeller domain-containing protein n=1 Tax=Tortispora caseinolytica NRRL Y-17796 TaxID=767744 RepID=A0A1E4TKZ7_9ASCO|nr:hypothetical protein CANCADRAFT_43039 [Tortispora caseinolytica NRRL Y-17796]